jgi:spore maturation protein CgeB
MKALGFSPSVRLFEAAACGAPIISDNWPGIESIFKPGSELLIADSPRDVIDILTQMPEEKRLAILAKASARLLREHTPAHRAVQLEGFYQEAVARRQSTKGLRIRSNEVEEAK